MDLKQRLSWLSFFAAAILLGSCGAQPAPEEPRPTEDVVRDAPEKGIIPVRELDAEGRIRVRRLLPDDFLIELQTRVFPLKQILPPQIDPAIPGATRIEDWEFYAVVDALLTRDIHLKRLGKLVFDAQTACFIARDTALVLDRVGDLIRRVDVDNPSDRLQELLRAREEKEEEDFAVLHGVPKADHKVREQGNLELGQLPDLMRKAHEVVASVQLGDEQRAALRQPLLNLKDEIDRIQGREKQRRYY
jgi:hypothetical protein